MFILFGIADSDMKLKSLQRMLLMTIFVASISAVCALTVIIAFVRKDR